MIQNLIYKNLQNFKNIINHYSLICYSNINILNIFLAIILVYSLYKFYYILYDGFISFTFSFLISFLISTYVLNNFKYSNNIIIKLLQIFLIYIISFSLIMISLGYIGWLLDFYPTIECETGNSTTNKTLENINTTTIDSNIGSNAIKDKELINVGINTNSNNDVNYTITASKELVDKNVDRLVNAAKIATENIVPNLGVGTAAGAAASAAVKASTNLPPLQRLAFIGSTAGVVAFGTKIGQKVGSSVKINDKIDDAIRNSIHSNPNIDRIPSPDNTFINNILEKGDFNLESPLKDLLVAQFSLDVLSIFLVILLLILIFNKFILNSNLEFILYLINKYLPNKIKEWLNKKLKKSTDYNNKFILLMFIIISISLILILLLKLFVSVELVNDLDKYITVHNYIYSNKV